jgi:hypothetical protein
MTSLLEAQVLNELAGHLYNFLPGSGNNAFSFPIAAAKVGVAEFWMDGPAPLLSSDPGRRHAQHAVARW